MFYAREVQIRQAQERIQREAALAVVRRPQAGEPSSSSSIRRAIGHRFIEIGARLAAEPSLESVRSR